MKSKRQSIILLTVTSLGQILITSCVTDVSTVYFADMYIWNASEETIIVSGRSEGVLNVKTSIPIGQSKVLYRKESEAPIIDEATSFSAQYRQFLDVFLSESPEAGIVISSYSPRESTGERDSVIVDFLKSKVEINSNERLRRRDLRENRTKVYLVFEGFR